MLEGDFPGFAWFHVLLEGEVLQHARYRSCRKPRSGEGLGDFGRPSISIQELFNFWSFSMDFLGFSMAYLSKNQAASWKLGFLKLPPELLVSALATS